MNIYDQKYIFKLLVKLIYLIDSKDNYTKMHSNNVTKYALLLGEELKLDNEDLEILEMGAMLHDIGKIGIPDYILVKDSRLTDEEFELTKKHVTIGEILLPNEGFKEIKSMIRSHHERLDGKGYPDGLKGSEIPYLARIISVADTFDAMTTKRAYNNIKTLDEALDELLKVSKKQINNDEVIQQLDPYIVRSFIKLIKNNPELIEEFKERDKEIINNRYKDNFQKKLM